MNILHLTDWHIDGPEGSKEPLSKHDYRKYISSLKFAINDEIDFIILTGDFINKGKVKLFSHVKDVINNLATEFLNGDNKNIFICPGEHDYIEIPSEYDRRKFKEEFKYEDDKFTTIEDEKISFLMLDSTKELTEQRRKKIIKNINLTDINYLIIGSHHPISPLFNTEEGELKIKHTDYSWSSKANRMLLKEIDTLNPSCHIICLSGDIHYSQEETYNFLSKKHSVIDYFSTPRFGSVYQSTADYLTEQKRGARLLTIKDNIITSSILEHTVQQQHKATVNLGDYNWDKLEHKISNLRLDYNQKPQNTKIELIGEEDENIKSKIKSLNLYKFGRHYTSDNGTTALSWIVITPLLADSKIFDKTIHEIISKIDSLLNNDSVIILGLDNWGAAIASQVSIKTGIKNHCIAVESKGKNHTDSDIINDEIKSEVQTKKNIILITDVISSGESLQYIYNEITGNIADNADNTKKWIVFSVICDEKQQREERLKFVTSNYTMCNSLRMPIIDNSILPDKTFIPINLNLCANLK